MKSSLFPDQLNLHLFHYYLIFLQDRWAKLQGVMHEKSYTVQAYTTVNTWATQEYHNCPTKSFYLPSQFIWSYSLPQIWTQFETISLICGYFNCLLLIAPQFLDNLYIIFSLFNSCVFLLVVWFGFLQNCQRNQFYFSLIYVPLSSISNFHCLVF